MSDTRGHPADDADHADDVVSLEMSAHNSGSVGGASPDARPASGHLAGAGTGLAGAAPAAPAPHLSSARTEPGMTSAGTPRAEGTNTPLALRVTVRSTLTTPGARGDLGALADSPSFFIVVQVGELPKQRSEVAQALPKAGPAGDLEPSFNRSSFAFELPQAFLPAQDAPVPTGAAAAARASKLAVHLALFRALDHHKGHKGKGQLVGAGSASFAPSLSALRDGAHLPIQLALTADGKPDGDAVATIRAELSLEKVVAVGGRRATEPSGSGSLVYRVLVRCAMNLPLVGPDDDLPDARVDVCVATAAGAGALSTPPSPTAAVVSTACTGVVHESRNPRWDTPLDVQANTSLGVHSSLKICLVDVAESPSGSRPGTRSSAAPRPQTTMLSVDLPTRLLRVGHCYNMHLTWPDADASLFVTVVVMASPSFDVRSSARPMQRLQVELHGFAGHVPSMWLDSRRSAVPRDGTVTQGGLNLLAQADLVVAASLLNANTGRQVVAHQQALSSGGRGAGAGAGAGSSVDEEELLQLPLGSLRVAGDGTLEPHSVLLADVRNAKAMRSLTQVSGPARCTPAQPQWNEAIMFDVGRPEDADAVFGKASNYPARLGLTTSEVSTLVLTFFRRPLPPVSPARGPNVRRRSLASVAGGHSRGVSAPTLCLGRAVIALPTTLALDGTPLQLDSVQVSDLTVTTEWQDGVSTVSKADPTTTSIPFAVTLRAWDGPAFVESADAAAAVARQAAQRNEQLAAREAAAAAASSAPTGSPGGVPSNFRLPPASSLRHLSPSTQTAWNEVRSAASSRGTRSSAGHPTTPGSLVTVTPRPSDTMNSNHAEQLSNANMVIKRLKQEVDRRTKAIHACGDEITRLRQQNRLLSRKAKDLHQTVASERLAKQREEKALLDEALNAAMFNTEPGDADALLRRVKLLARKYISEKRNSARLQRQLAIAKKASLSADDSHARYDKLVKAHTKQNAMLQRLQEEVAEMRVLKETIKTQERVIAKLEDVLESRVANASAGSRAVVDPRARHFRTSRTSSPSGSVPVPPTRSARSRKSASRPATRTSRPATAASEASHQSDLAATDQPAVDDSATAPEDDDDPTAETIMEGEIDPMDGNGPEMTCTIRAWNKAMSRLKSRAVRVEVLEEHLLTAAREFAGEMSQIKVKLMEYEMGMMGSDSDAGGSSGGDDDDDDASGGGASDWASDADESVAASSDHSGAEEAKGAGVSVALPPKASFGGALLRTDSFSRPMIKQPDIHASGSIRRQPAPALSPLG